MKKICFFINSDWYFDLHWLDRATGIKSKGFEVHVVAHFSGDSVLNKLINLGFVCHKSSMDSQTMNPFSNIYSACRLFIILRKINADIIHCITIKPCLIGGCYARFFKKNVIISFVGLGRIFSKSTKKLNILSKLIIPIYKFIFNNKKCLLSFEHERDKEQLVAVADIPIERAVVIDGAGVDIKKYPYTPEVAGKIPVILFASRLLKSKGLNDLIEVKKRLAEKDIKFRLDVAGIPVPGDPDGIDISILQKLHKKNAINWLGKCDDMVKLLIEANIVALPSVYSEGVPRILLEAAAIGRAIISYDVGGCSSIVKDLENGYLVDKGDVDFLTDRLESLILNDELRKKMGSKGRMLVEKKFTTSIVLYKTLEMYEHSLALKNLNFKE